MELENRIIALSLMIPSSPCHSHCKHCYAKSDFGVRPSKIREFSFEEIKEMMGPFLNYTGEGKPIQRLALGLEPETMSHSQYMIILEYLLNNKNIIQNSIPTDGFTIAREDCIENLIRLRELGIDHFQLTLHGFKDNHDHFVGRKNAFEDVMLAAKKIYEAGLDIWWEYFLNKHNQQDIGRVIEEISMISKEGPKGIHIRTPGYCGRAVKFDNLRATIEQTREVSEEYPKFSKLKGLKSEKEHIEDVKKGVIVLPERPKHFLSIMIDTQKNVSSKHFPYVKIGPLKGLTIEEILKKALAEDNPLSDKWYSIDNQFLAERYGDPNNNRAYDQTSIRIKWFVEYIKKEFPELMNFSHSMPQNY
jgi:MoaA/NifB/PqqE/SkfB family radical SAM enzyme